MKRVFLILTFVVFIFVIGSIINLYIFVNSPSPMIKEKKRVTIPQGASLKKISYILEKEDIVKSWWKFYIYARYKVAHTSLKAGDYLFKERITPKEVLDQLIKGKVEVLTITLPEGITIRKITKLLNDKGLANEKDLLKIAFSSDFLKSLGIPGKSIEGYLFPDTYCFTRHLPPEVILTNMVENFRKKTKDLPWEKAKDFGLSRYQIVILASIIEKETSLKEEMPIISAVFHKRLKKGIRLCSDPTVIYGLGGFNGNLTKKDLTMPTPYNTYIISGLPPTPICNPGLNAIEAALNPAKVPYLYFVSKNNGSHYFSVTLKEHNRAVKLYQRKRKVYR